MEKWTVVFFTPEVSSSDGDVTGNIKERAEISLEMEFGELQLILSSDIETKRFSHKSIFDEDYKTFKSPMDASHYEWYFVERSFLYFDKKSAEIILQYC